ncbi:KIR protein [Plasmodium coatneyi]|uniref:KIR protein n=1 Tax=Plasmodium coatneyi TaxID=208452 RepID=A0A1B1DTN5_9APIC|nr:KIR protein [Plasmodium coatneyi]ANQ06122.1 KIR protein [Plasmodium coatneyi]
MVIRGRDYKEQVESTLENVLGLYNINKGNLTNELIKNYCYACGRMGIRHPANRERCHFLYYLIGSTVGGKLSDNRFSNVMGKIYQILGRFPELCECTNIYPDISWDIFQQRKKVFDCCYNYDTIKKQLELPRSQCDSKYNGYLQKALSAYEAIRDNYCGDNRFKSSSYCMKFRNDYESKNPQVLLNLEKGCTPTPKKPSAGDDFDLGDAVVSEGK